MLKQLAADLTSSSYKVVYDISGNDREGALKGTFTLAGKDGSQLLGFEGSVGALAGHFILIREGDSSFLCIDGQGQQACLKARADAPHPIPLPAVFSVDDILEQVAQAPGLAVTPAGTAKIAGADAHCWDVSGNGGKGHLCVSDTDGALLSLDGEFGGSRITLKARESGQPEDGDFEPPYPVVDLGG